MDIPKPQITTPQSIQQKVNAAKPKYMTTTDLRNESNAQKAKKVKKPYFPKDYWRSVILSSVSMTLKCFSQAFGYSVGVGIIFLVVWALIG